MGETLGTKSLVFIALRGGRLLTPVKMSRRVLFHLTENTTEVRMRTKDGPPVNLSTIWGQGGD